MLYNDLRKKAMTICKAETLLGKDLNIVKMEKSNSRALHINNGVDNQPGGETRRNDSHWNSSSTISERVLGIKTQVKDVE